MHQLLASLFSLLAAFCHSLSPVHPVQAAELPASIVLHSSEAVSGQLELLPDRYQLARYAATDFGYAGTACISCRRTEETLNTR